MLKKLSILLLILTMLLSGCGSSKPQSGVITLGEDEYTVTLEDYPLTILGSGFIINMDTLIATGQFISEEQRVMSIDKAKEENLTVSDEETLYVYREGGTEEDAEITYTAIMRIDEKYSYLVSLTNLETLLDIMQKFSFSHATVTVPPTPTTDPAIEEEVEEHDHDHEH